MPQSRNWMKHEDLTRQTIGAFYDVYHALGYGFLEKVYENALAYELRQRGLQVEQQAPLAVFFEDIIVGEYLADLIVERKVLLVLNFGPKPDHKRQAMDNPLKPHHRRNNLN